MDSRLMATENPLFSTLHHMMSMAAAQDSAAAAATDRKPPSSSSSYVMDAKAIAATLADVMEYPDYYAFVIDMPGVKSGDIKVQVENDNVLVIAGERRREEEEENAKFLRMERRVGKFLRRFALPENANTDAISAVCQDGVLTVTVQKLPPPQPKKPRTIEVQVA